MPDPLSVAAGIVAVLSAAQVLYNFIDSIADAPKLLDSAKSDLNSTVKILEDLREYLGGESDCGRWSEGAVGLEQALRPVLSRCLELCEAFKLLLDGLVKHSKKEIKVRDRTKLALKEKDIQAFRDDMRSARESIGIAVSGLDLIVSTKSYETIQNFHRDAFKAVKDIERRLNDIQSAIRVHSTQRMGSDNAMMKSLEEQKSALEEHLRLCKESLASVEKPARYISVFGDTKSGHGAKTFQGIQTRDLQGGIDQTYGDSDLGPQSFTWMGVGDSETVSRFFQSTRREEGQVVQNFGQSHEMRSVFGVGQAERIGPWITQSSSMPAMNLTASLPGLFDGR